MSRFQNRHAWLAWALSAGMAAAAHAAEPVPFTPAPRWTPPTVSEAKRDSWDSVQRARTQPLTPRPLHYPNLDASLYPCPVPTVPYEMGGTVLTNSYLSPHEMLYHHHYRALYPPYYYKVKWQYGVRLTSATNAHGTTVPVLQRTKVMHKVALQGTQVDVKYSSWSPLDLFVAPNQ